MSNINLCPICLGSEARTIIKNEMNLKTGQVYVVSVKYQCQQCGMNLEHSCVPDEVFPDLLLQQRTEMAVKYLSGIIRQAWNEPRCLEIKKKVLLP